MKRVLKANHGAFLQGATLRSEDDSFNVLYLADEWKLTGSDNDYGIYTRKNMGFEYTLKVRETEKSFLYELNKKEIEVMESNIFENVKEVISSEEFRANNEAFIEFETKNEKGFGFVKEGQVFIPVREVSEGIELVRISEEDFIKNDFVDINRTVLSSYNKIFKFNKTEDLKFKKKDNITLNSFNESREVILYDGIDSVYNSNGNLIIVGENKKTLYEKVVGKSISFVHKTDVEVIPGEFKLVYKKYIPSKTTSGITDLKSNPFAWLSY